MQAIGWFVLFGLAVVAIYGMATLGAAVMAGSRLEQAQERMEREVQEMNAALDAAIAYQPAPVELTLENLAEQVNQQELRLRALERKVG